MFSLKRKGYIYIQVTGSYVDFAQGVELGWKNVLHGSQPKSNMLRSITEPEGEHFFLEQVLAAFYFRGDSDC